MAAPAPEPRRLTWHRHPEVGVLREPDVMSRSTLRRGGRSPTTHDLGEADLGRARRVSVRLLAVVGLLAFCFMLVFAASDAASRVGGRTELEPPGSREARIGAEHPGELVHITGAVAAAAIGASGLGGLLVRPQRAGSATQTAAASLAMLVTIVLVGDPDNHGGQAGLVDPAFVIFGLPPLAAAAVASPWRAWRPDGLVRPRLLLLAALAAPGVWYGLEQGLMQRNTWPPLADPHHQVHWYAMSLLAFAAIFVAAGAALRGTGWRLAATLAGGSAAAVALASLIDPEAASALHPVWAVAAAAWGVAVIVVAWSRAADAGA